MLWHIFWLLLSIAAAGLIILVTEARKEENNRSLVTIIVALSILIVSLVSTMIIANTISFVDIDILNLDTGQVYYLNATVPAVRNPDVVSLVVVKWDISRGQLQDPTIIAVVNKNLIASDVIAGKYIIKNLQGKIETWNPPSRN